MTASNSRQIKRRSASTTLLVFGEGLAEKAFLDHVKECYFDRYGGASIKIRAGRGGSPVDIVIDAIRTEGSYDQTVVILDNDRPRTEMTLARQVAAKNNIVLIESTPCLEATLLELLNPGSSYSNKAAQDCKREFENNHISSRKRTDQEEYAKVFPKELLDQSEHPVLDQIKAIIK